MLTPLLWFAFDSAGAASAPKGRNRRFLSRSNVMRLVMAISIVSVIGLMPALAAELPSRKPGLWEMKMEFASRNAPGQTMQQCIDASTDQMMQSNIDRKSTRLNSSHVSE